MTDKQLIRKRINKNLVNELTIAGRLMDITNIVLNNDINATDLSTLYIALEELKVLYDIDEKDICKIYNHTMKSYREQLYETERPNN